MRIYSGLVKKKGTLAFPVNILLEPLTAHSTRSVLGGGQDFIELLNVQIANKRISIRVVGEVGWVQAIAASPGQAEGGTARNGALLDLLANSENEKKS